MSFKDELKQIAQENAREERQRKDDFNIRVSKPIPEEELEEIAQSIVRVLKSHLENNVKNHRFSYDTVKTMFNKTKKTNYRYYDRLWWDTTEVSDRVPSQQRSCGSVPPNNYFRLIDHDNSPDELLFASIKHLEQLISRIKTILEDEDISVHVELTQQREYANKGQGHLSLEAYISCDSDGTIL